MVDRHAAESFNTGNSAPTIRHDEKRISRVLIASAANDVDVGKRWVAFTFEFQVACCRPLLVGAKGHWRVLWSEPKNDAQEATETSEKDWLSGLVAAPISGWAFSFAANVEKERGLGTTSTVTRTRGFVVVATELT